MGDKTIVRMFFELYFTGGVEIVTVPAAGIEGRKPRAFSTLIQADGDLFTRVFQEDPDPETWAVHFKKLMDFLWWLRWFRRGMGFFLTGCQWTGYFIIASACFKGGYDIFQKPLDWKWWEIIQQIVIISGHASFSLPFFFVQQIARWVVNFYIRKKISKNL
jgi:hypothetical protein